MNDDWKFQQAFGDSKNVSDETVEGIYFFSLY